MDLTFDMVKKNTIFRDRHILTRLIPPNGKFEHREQQRNKLILELAPLLTGQRASNLFVYGMPGTGKTALMTDLRTALEKQARKDNIELATVMVNCEKCRTDTLILTDILRQLRPETRLPRSGMNRSAVLSDFTEWLTELELSLLVVLDEIDKALLASGDDILFFLSRLKDDSRLKANVCTVMISNDVQVQTYLQPKTQSSFGRTRIIFPQYDAQELATILGARAELAFCENVLADGVIEKIAALEARSGGDAREAIELLDTCGKLAMARRSNRVELDLVSEALEHLESETVLHVAVVLPLHQKLLFLALLEPMQSEVTSIQAWLGYVALCEKLRYQPLSRRRIQSFLVQFDAADLTVSEMSYHRGTRKKVRRITFPYPQEVRASVKGRLCQLLGLSDGAMSPEPVSSST